MPPLALQEEGLTKGATTPLTAPWNALHKAATQIGYVSL